MKNIYLSVIIILCLLFSCEKNREKVWDNCYNLDYDNIKGYIPLPWKDAIWEVETQGYDNIRHIELISTAPDTSFNNQCYQTLVLEETDINLNTGDTLLKEYTLYGWLRQEIPEKKVYYVDPRYPDTEHLLYDFSLQKGDTLKEDFYGITSQTIFAKIHDIDSILINNRYHKVFIIQGDNLLNAIYWVEGIGSERGIKGNIYSLFTYLKGFYYREEKIYYGYYEMKTN